MTSTSRRRSGKVLALGTVAALVLGACGSGSDGGESKADADTVTIDLLTELTGAAAFCGKSVRAGAEAAVKKANADKMLDGVTIKLKVRDTATDPRKASAAMSDAASSDAVSTIFGCSSAEAVAIAPIAQDEEIPLVAVQSGTEGVVDVGDYVFRTTAPQASYHKKQVDHWETKGVKSVAIAYQTDNPTLVDLGEKVYPDLFDDAGIKLVKSSKFAGDGFDFTGLANGIVKAKPDAVLVLGQGTPNVTIVTQVLQSGFEGLIGGTPGFSGGVLKPLGAKANGLTWPTDFHPDADNAGTKDFVASYTKITGTEAAEIDAFTAEAWDAVMFTVAGLEQAPSFSRSDVREGMSKAADEGIDAAVGRLTFEDRDARADGVLIEWQDATARLVP
ncbi:ABC transporter substrate-binding protein [Aeromicrobium sp. SMF47]|uniref:ABC transporter substrate-binding protein n=1 Tax=Aeromicrobium TaxID=2040 RepID=UPI00129D771E|nr:MULTISPECIES: ABC transporter substrate-binding protein [Aeromicrobium]MRJ75113.1 ABC transporter substrate-binding protein [Aeromicrobium yanjiei]MRK02831.1 ABC transporter substrate-binding protein [Aeromicrobium sp. S22]